MTNKHARSGLHKEAILKVQYLKQPGIDVHLNNQHLATLKVRRDNLLILLSSLKYLLRQGLAIRGHEEINGNLMQLLLLQAKGNCALQSFISDKHYLSNDIINEMIKLMSRTVLQQLLVEIRKAGWFSLIADETTDVSHKEQLYTAIRWVDNLFQINQMPLELINVPKTDADTITHLIKDYLIRMSLPIGKCRGQAYDGAASMSGHINGVAAQIQRVEPSAIFVHCLAHCTNLCLQEVGKQILCVREALDLVMELSQLIRYSPKRLTLFESLMAQVSPGAPSLKPLCPTRWTVRTRAINAVLTNYRLLQETLEIIKEGKDEYALKAIGYLNSIDKFSTYFGLELSNLVFSATEQLSITLQGTDTSLQQAVQAAKLAVHYMERQRNDAAYDSFYSYVLAKSESLTDQPTLPRQRRLPKRIDSGSTAHQFDNPKVYFKKQYFEVLNVITAELKRRFQQDRGMPIAALLE